MPDAECFEACNGVEALALVEKHQPDLVLLDLRMPEMDGWQAARRIRELENGRDVPIIALSVTASPGAEAYAIHAGCNEFVTKPVSDYSTLMTRLTHWLRPLDGDQPRPEAGDAEICVLCRQPLPRVFRRGGDARRQQTAR
ncbi:MAG: response regulator [Deltaproteobacteria bacterium]|nr:response regulator [Deltaproteobacteria bacterium]